MSSWRRESVTVGLAALVLGAVAAGSVSVAAEVAQPATVTGGIAQPDRFVLAELNPAAAPPTGPQPAAGAGSGSAPGSAAVPEPTTPPPTTTTEPPPTTTPPPPSSTTTQAPPPAPPAPASQTDQVVALVNSARAAAGCPAVTVDDRLTNAAQGHSADMATERYFSHTSQDGRTFADRIRAAGYSRPAAENIARGQRSAQQVMEDWMNSSGHRANILNCGIKTIGVGLDTRGWYWTQNFGR